MAKAKISAAMPIKIIELRVSSLIRASPRNGELIRASKKSPCHSRSYILFDVEQTWKRIVLAQRTCGQRWTSRKSASSAAITVSLWLGGAVAYRCSAPALRKMLRAPPERSGFLMQKKAPAAGREVNRKGDLQRFRCRQAKGTATLSPVRSVAHCALTMIISQRPNFMRRMLAN
jgi:hypothetical protein